MARQLEADIIIKGAGPVGLSMANLLGVYGIRTLVLEQNPGTVDEPRAIGLDVESGRALQSMGLEEITSAEMMQGFTLDYLNAKGRTLMDVEVGASPYGGAQMSSFIQPILEQQLLDGTDRFDNVTVLFNHKVDEVSQTDRQAIARGTNTDGEAFEAHAPYLVGCGGGRSLVRKTSNITMEGFSNPEAWLVIDTIDPQLDDWVDCRFFCDPKRPAMTMKKLHKHRRWEWMLHEGESEEEFLDQNRINELLAPHTDPSQVTMLRKCVYNFNSIVAEQYRNGRLFIAGDAAHMMPPFAGQGMNSGIRDAMNLSWKLAAVVKGEASPNILDTYQAERRDHVVKLTKVANRLGAIIMPTTKVRAWARDIVLTILNSFEVTRNALRESFFVIPKLEDGLFVWEGPGATKLSGEMIVQPIVEDIDGNQARLDEFLPESFVLLGIGEDPAVDLDAAAQSLCADLGIQMIAVAPQGITPSTGLTDLTGELNAWKGALPAFVLLRPDRFTAAVFNPADATAALRSFAGQYKP
jgi:3-(3-hydroxy-phenyl)propionate hydroxylase